jgi:hypothetical protein
MLEKDFVLVPRCVSLNYINLFAIILFHKDNKTIYIREYITRISQLQKLQNSKLLAKIRGNIEM